MQNNTYTYIFSAVKRKLVASL